MGGLRTKIKLETRPVPSTSSSKNPNRKNKYRASNMKGCKLFSNIFDIHRKCEFGGKFFSAASSGSNIFRNIYNENWAFNSNERSFGCVGCFSSGISSNLSYTPESNSGDSQHTGKNGGPYSR